jgi:DNA mismatch endonuclease, patch repair protein
MGLAAPLRSVMLGWRAVARRSTERSPRGEGRRPRLSTGSKKQSAAEPAAAIVRALGNERSVDDPDSSTSGAGREKAGVAAPLPAPRYRQREGHLLLVDDTTSARMALVRQKGTRPELVVRGALTELGHRFRLDNRSLDGSPDIANRSRRWVVFVHGCFWHRHGCKATTTPTRNREFWEAKFLRNVERDRRAIEALRARGYTVVVVWECETKRNPEQVSAQLASALGAPLRRG